MSQILLKLWLIGNGTSCRPIRSVIILVIKQIGLPLRGRPILLITRMITDRIGLHSVLLPILIVIEMNNFFFLPGWFLSLHLSILFSSWRRQFSSLWWVSSSLCRRSLKPPAGYCSQLSVGSRLQATALPNISAVFDSVVQCSTFCCWLVQGILIGVVIGAGELSWTFAWVCTLDKIDLKIEVFRHFPRTANVKKSRDQSLAVRFAVWGSRLYVKTTL